MRTTLLVLAVAVASTCVSAQRRTVGSPHAVWDPFEFVLYTGAKHPSGNLNERSSSPNPWLDFRMQCWFLSPSGEIFSSPGFYAADGRGGNAGPVWKVRFSPSEPGTWVAGLWFEEGTDINVQDLKQSGKPLWPHGQLFFFHVENQPSNPQGFMKHGPLEVSGERYLRHRDGTWFMKSGTNSPENMLGYVGFDGTQDYGGLPRGPFLHKFETHAADWRPGDPNWTSNGDPNAGKAIIGAVNYLSSVGVNSMYFLPLNLGGDGQETHPFIDGSSNSYYNTSHYDVGRMEQWDDLFGHAQRKGIKLDFVLAEREGGNIRWLGSGFSKRRQLYLKMMMAMFGHHLGLRWILCEENEPEPTNQFLVQDLDRMGKWLQQWQTFNHPIAVHTIPDDLTIYDQIFRNTSGEWLTSAALQVHRNYNPSTEAALDLFERYSRSADINVDEQGPASTGLSNNNTDDMRRLALWDVLLSGGNIAWYCGYHNLPVGGDIQLEDFRTRGEMWEDTTIARELLETMEYWKMEPDDDLVTRETRHSRYGDAEVFAERGKNYVIYYADAQNTGMIDLRHTSSSDSFEARWFNPRTGVWVGTPRTFQGGQTIWAPAAPSPSNLDWVYVLNRK